MGTLKVVAVVVVVFVASTALALDKYRMQMRDDFGTEPLYDCALNYYYYTPCPTYSWFWAFTGWAVGDIIGEWFQVGDVSMFGWTQCEPENCHNLEQIRVLDFAGYGQLHPGLFTIEFDVYCADEFGCPIGPSLWNSGPRETGYAWNYFTVDPPISICGCSVDPGPPPSRPRILVTATHTGTQGIYPAWGTDNISTPVEQACVMHEYGCLPAYYPRPYSSHYATIHSGCYGNGSFRYCPPKWFLDGRDLTPDGTQYGFVELAWRIYLICAGPTETEPATWGRIKSMYR
jgi:hypothetical protein